MAVLGYPVLEAYAITGDLLRSHPWHLEMRYFIFAARTGSCSAAPLCEPFVGDSPLVTAGSHSMASSTSNTFSNSFARLRAPQMSTSGNCPR